MRKNLLRAATLATVALFAFSCKQQKKETTPADQVIIGTTQDLEKKDGYDGPEARYRFEFERIKDPKLDYLPGERLLAAIDYTVTQKAARRNQRTQGALNWIERGPIYDVVGPSNGNRRGGAGTNYTSGRTRAILVDTLNDPTGNTVFCGSVSGGLWKCTNFLTGGSNPNWTPVDDRFENLAIAYITQDPTTPTTMYFASGEPYSNSDAVIGLGVWKSIDAGATWTRLTSSSGFRKIFKLVSDNAGNLYLGNRTTTNPASSADGIYRSTNGGSTWQNITPSVRTSGNAICTDIEFTQDGRLHASFGYSTGATTVQHQYTNIPTTVSSGSGWNASSGIRLDVTVPANRLELASSGNILYAVTTNSSNNVDSCYKSVDAGATWTKQNATAYTSGLTNTQGWYNLTLSINPANTDEIMVGGLDAYKSVDAGATISRQTYWVTTAPYVHADHHFMQWGVAGLASRIVIGCDGGVFISNDNGVTWADKNRNMGIKQFYAGAIHPAAGSNYVLAGAQDNGVHQLNQAGNGPSVEVTGGDGAYVHISQQNPQVQFGSYVYNQFRRSTDGGNTWSSINFSSTAGRFINPWDYDDGRNNLYSCWASNTILRWRNANTSTAAETITISALSGTPSAFKVSPYTQDRLFIATGNGRIIQVNNASTVTAANVATNVTNLSAGLPGGYISCVNTGSSDNFLVATYSSYGVPQVWYSTNGGTSWTNINGNLPDMPVRWAVFDPQNNSKMFIATEAGVYYTDAINGTSTVWTSDPSFPTVRTDMLKLRLSDNTIMAATHGRGVYTAVIPATPEIRFNAPFATVNETGTTTLGCRRYTDYAVDVSSVVPSTGDATVTYTVTAGASAVQGIDYDFTTNGNFAAASTQHVFQSGVGGTKQLNIRVYDDDAIEPEKSFTINFSVSGATDAVAGAFTSFKFTITDDDRLPVPSIAPTNFTVGTNANALSAQSVLRSNMQKHRVQILIRASELLAMGAPAGGGDIVSLTDSVLTKNSTKAFRNYTISIGSTTATNLGSGFLSGLTQVYSNNYTSVLGDNTFNFGTGTGSAAFIRWNGTSNIVVQFCFDNGSDAADAAADIMIGDAPFGIGSDADNYPTIYSNSNTGSGCSLGAAFIANYRIKVKLGIGTSGQPVESAITTKSSYVAPDFTVPFYSGGTKVMASIVNGASQNFGCTEVKIDRAGTSAVPFWNNNPANYVMEKTYLITPTTNSSSAQYQATFYFTAAEKAGWEAVTGKSWNDIKLIKTQGPISNVTPANPSGAGSVEIVTPTFGTYGADYTLSYTFNTGFSGFAFGDPGLNILPITLLEFTGRQENTTAVLNWKTSSEQNSKDFEVEKSTDGRNFSKIGTVPAAGNSSSQRTYSFRDVQLSAANYYRLRMNDSDGQYKYSDVVLVNYGAGAQQVTVVNNPFAGYLDIRFARSAANARLQLVSTSGAVVAEKQFTNLSGQLRWQLPAQLSRGTYVLRSVVDGKTFTQKLIKQ
ncbi:MAG TPA: T9SS type A sorting domain-containing protein [Flavisolibacter sp.]|nr:T9SS type A sorting domain-containing protein [Flavisolibacter sp.]